MENIRNWSRTVRFLRAFARDSRRPRLEREVVLPSGRPATIYLPRSGTSSADRAWVLLHGITVPGRHHAAVRRMARAFAASGAVVYVPEVPEWRELRLSPTLAIAAAHESIAGISESLRLGSSSIGMGGFSVAGTWALQVAAELGERRPVFSFSGYRDVGQVLVAMISGSHEWRGAARRYRPDPYGRWIMGANLLPLLDGETYGTQEERDRLAAGLRQLALTAGQNGALADESTYDSLIRSLDPRAGDEAGAVWRLLAPLSTEAIPSAAQATPLAQALADAAISHEAWLDPERHLSRLTGPVFLLHGRNDRLIPFTETLRLAADIEKSRRVDVTITRLVGHTKSAESRRLRSPLTIGREATKFVGAMHRLVNSFE